jgi:intracellular multiplication protein IcmJ
MRPEPGSGRVPGYKHETKSTDLSFMVGKHLPKDLKEKIHERDNHACHFCGFTSSKYQNIHHKDMNLNNQDEGNLMTACVFCHQCFYLDYVAKMESGMLVWLPEIPQTGLNQIARAIYVGRISQGDIAEASRNAYSAILKRREEAEKRLGTDNPYILAQVLQDYLGGKAYARRHEKLDGLRLFPLDKRMVTEGELTFNQFPQVLAFWRSKNGPFGEKQPNNWVGLVKGVLQA